MKVLILVSPGEYYKTQKQLVHTRDYSNNTQDQALKVGTIFPNQLNPKWGGGPFMLPFSHFYVKHKYPLNMLTICKPLSNLCLNSICYFCAKINE